MSVLTSRQISVLGSALVLLMVVALPVMLAVLPAESLTEDHAGAGAGDLTAAALNSLDRGLQDGRVTPIVPSALLAYVPRSAPRPRNPAWAPPDVHPVFVLEPGFPEAGSVLLL